MKCPKCRHYIEDGSESHAVCGWNVQQRAPEKVSYRTCEWSSDSRQCRYPGSISPNTRDGGPWYCALHYACDSAAYGAEVVRASMDYRHPTIEELQAERTVAALESLKAKGLDRQPSESSKDWMKRTSLWMRGKGPKRMDEAA